MALGLKKATFDFTVCTGIDFAITDDSLLHAEYGYSDFGKKKFIKNIIINSYAKI
ncbi:hypothetical protein [Bartonella grahamii]|uniref:Uncharacterized protein n=1 Tax=Bartonella grahamii TaxID=33045 RepID=A0A336NCW1_BARGR|nr:hypothetical protein [Bartonella grahamii]SSZ40101.1 Uncharacterised protein [Bartonella grahamii]